MRFALVIGLLVSSAMYAQDHERTFSVQPIEHAQVQELAQAEAKVEIAVKTLREADEALKKAAAERDTLVSKIKSGGHPFEAECGTPTNANYYTMRKYRRVEIHGEYLLISDGESACSSWGQLTIVR
jgi:hypothetical protein